MNRLLLRPEDLERMIAHARACLPEEACGLIGGTVGPEGERRVERVFLLENTDHSPEHFSLSPRDQLPALRELREQGWQLLGNWHSHPSTPSRPSPEDCRMAYDSRASYLILSLMEREPVLNAFHIEGDLVEKEVLEVAPF